MGIKIFRICLTSNLLAGFQTGLAFRIKEGFPEDAKIMSAKILEGDSEEIEMEVYSKIFPAIPKSGEEFLVPVMDRIDDNLIYIKSSESEAIRENSIFTEAATPQYPFFSVLMEGEIGMMFGKRIIVRD